MRLFSFLNDLKSRKSFLFAAHVSLLAVPLPISSKVFAEELPDSAIVASDNKDDQDNVRRYTLEELRQETPKPAPPPESYLISEVKGFANRLGQNQNGQNKKLLDFYNGNPVPTKSDYQMHLAAFQFDRDYSTQTKPRMIQEHIRLDSGKTFGQIARDRLTVFQAFKKGLDFKLDLKRLFSNKKNTSNSATPQNSMRTVRYGLIIKEIAYNQNQKTLRANVSDIDSDYKYAAKADVLWTIGPIYDQKEEVQKQLFNIENPHSKKTALTEPKQLALASNIPGQNKEHLDTFESNQYPLGNQGLYDENIHQFAAQPPPNKSQFTLFAPSTAPSSEFDCKLKPAIGEDNTAPKGLPGAELSCTQKEQLYIVKISTKLNLKREGMVHIYKLPIVGILAIGRTYDEHFVPVSTSIYNLLVSPRLPLITINKYEKDDHYDAGIGYTRKNWSIGLKAETPPQWDYKKRGTQKGEKYEIGYNLNF